MKQGAVKMSGIITVLRVFRNSTLITAQGEFEISRVFNSRKTARKARYHYYCTDKGISIYARRDKKGKSVFAVIDN
jgi:hypothetical protein